MNIVAVVKTVAAPVVSMGVGAIVGNTIKASTPADAKIYTKIAIGVGSVVMASFAGDKIADYTKDQIEATAVQLRELKSMLPHKK